MDMNSDFVNQFPELNNISMVEEFNMANCPQETLLAHQQPAAFQASSFTWNLPSTSHVIDDFNALPGFDTNIPLKGDLCHEKRKRKVMKLAESSSASVKKNSLGRGKKWRSNSKGVDKPEEVIQVRSKRGQATDSHSLAERVRRERINNKMRFLQELVPGCQKTMGMAVMLDEIINYVHSLKNQVEFLSMELAAASYFHDLNKQKEAIRKLQGTTTQETLEMEKMAREGYGHGENPFFHSTTRPL